MPKSNKELAVDLYGHILKCEAIIMSSPNFNGKYVQIPSLDDAVEQVELLAAKLARVKDE